MKRRESRELALQVLFSLDFEKKSLDQIKKDFQSFDFLSFDDDFAFQLIESFISNQEQIDLLLQSKLKKWKLSRLNTADRACLRLGAIEITLNKMEKGVVINEYLEIAKKFSDTDSAAFINGVLDSLS